MIVTNSHRQLHAAYRSTGAANQETGFRDARLDDGLLDVVVFKNQSHWDLMRYVQAIVFGDHRGLPDVEYFQTELLHISAEGEVPVEIDGEIAGLAPFTFGFSPRKLRVLAPSKAATWEGTAVAVIR